MTCNDLHVPLRKSSIDLSLAYFGHTRQLLCERLRSDGFALRLIDDSAFDKSGMNIAIIGDGINPSQQLLETIRDGRVLIAPLSIAIAQSLKRVSTPANTMTTI